MVDWYYVDGSGAQQGPASASELQKMSGETYVWNEKLPEWTQIKKCPELSAPKAAAPPPPPPPPPRPPPPPAAPARAAPASRAPAPAPAPVPAPTARSVKAPTSSKQAQGAWKVRMTVDGGTYYHHTGTDEVSWDKPYELQSPEERQVTAPSPLDRDSADCLLTSCASPHSDGHVGLRLVAERSRGWLGACVRGQADGKSGDGTAR